MSKIVSFIKKPIVYGSAIVVVVAVALYSMYKKGVFN